MTDRNKTDFEVIESTRALLIVLVVLIHGIPHTDYHFVRLFDCFNLYEAIVFGISRNLAFIAVPAFMLISGYLFFAKCGEWTATFYFAQCKRRAMTLLLPYLIWNLLFILAILTKNFAFAIFGLPYDDHYILLNESNVLDIMWNIPINFPLWYMRDLICMVLISPLIYYFIKYLNFYGLTLLFFIQLAVPESSIATSGYASLFYFSLGASITIHKRAIVTFFSKPRPYTYIACVVLAFLSCYYLESELFFYFNKLYVLCGVISIFPIVGRLNRIPRIKKQLLNLSHYVFTIYVLHAIYVLDWIRGFLSKTYLARHEAGMILTYFLLAGFTIFACINFQYLFKKRAPRLFNLLSGARIR